MSRKETRKGGMRVAIALEAAAALAGSVEAALVTTIVGGALVARLATTQSE